MLGIGGLMLLACLGGPALAGALGGLGAGVLLGAGGAVFALALCAAVPAVALASRRRSSRRQPTPSSEGGWRLKSDSTRPGPAPATRSPSCGRGC